MGGEDSNEPTVEELLQQRERLKRQATEILQGLLLQEREKQCQIDTLKRQLEDVVLERATLAAEVLASERLPDSLSQLRAKVQEMHEQTQAYKDILSQQSVKDKKVHKMLLLSLSSKEEIKRRSSKDLRRNSSLNGSKDGNRRASSANTALGKSESAANDLKAQSQHKGIIVTEEGRTLQKRLDIIELRSGTFPRIVQWVAEDKSSGSSYFASLCLTYRSFSTAEELIGELQSLYGSYCVAESEEKGKKKRLRIIGFLKYWVTNHYEHDFQDNGSLRTLFEDFATSKISTVDGEVACKALLHAMKKLEKDCTRKLDRAATLQKASQMLGADVAHATSQANLTFSSKPPEPVKTETLHFAVVSPLEVARQLTIADMDSFCSIQPKECLSGNWAKRDSAVKAKNIMAMITRFNETCSIISSSILQEESIKKRAAVLSNWIQVGVHFQQLNNFNGVMEVVASLTSGPVFRLKRTWEKLTRSKLKTYEDLCVLMSADGSSRVYRSYLHTCNPPLVPYLGLYLKDLTFIEDGNPDVLENGQINFFKCTMIAQQIKELMQYQHQPYNLVRVHEIQVWLDSYPRMGEKEQYALSLERQPRKKLGV